ncbi:MAG: hypothetical protein U9Q18_02545 [Caldisericota bacterium]|nr:hypothetical protein [Caldisericota bacterium]
MNKVLKNILKVRKDRETTLDMERLVEIESEIPQKLRKKFIQSYTYLKLSIFWNNIHIFLANKFCFMSWNYTGKPPLDFPGSEEYLKSFLLDNFKNIIKPIGMLYFDLREKQVVVLSSFTYMYKDKDLSLQVFAWPKKDCQTIKEILHLFLSYYYKYNFVKKKEDKSEISSSAPLSNLSQPLSSAFEDLRKNKIEKVQEIIKQSSFCSSLKKHLIDKGIIKTDFSLQPNKQLVEVRKEINKFYNDYLVKYSPKRCPVCGRKYPKQKSNQTTCGKPACVMFKHRMKKEILKYIKDSKLNVKDMQFNEFYKIASQWNKQRLQNCKSHSCRKFHSLKALSQVLYNEITPTKK